MTELLILISPCIALIASIMDPAVSALVVLAFAVALSVMMTVLCLRTWKLRDDDEAEAEAEYESDAVIEDATNMVHASFAALARSGATSTSFRAVNGTVMHQNSTAGASDRGDRSAGRIWSEEDDTGSQFNSEMDGGEPKDWPEPFQAWRKDTTISRLGSRKGYAGFQRLGGFRILARNQEDGDRITQMV